MAMQLMTLAIVIAGTGVGIWVTPNGGRFIESRQSVVRGTPANSR